MGDRTYVTLTVLKEHRDIIKQLDDSCEEIDHTDDLVWFGFEEVNYGELPFLHTLVDQGIAYEASWASGDEYPEGEEITRFTEDGRVITKTFDETSHSVDLQKLLDLIDDPVGLVALIRKTQEDTTVLGWKNQIEYGKNYRMLQLLTKDEV